MGKLQNVELKVVGVTFKNDDGSSRKDLIFNMCDQSPIMLEREPNNKYDPNAIKVITDGGQIGYIGKDYSAILAEYMDAGRQFTAKVKPKCVGEYKGRPYCTLLIDEV